MLGFARWLMPRAVCHVTASGLRLSGEQKCMQIGPERTRAGLDTCQLWTPACALSKVLGPHCGRSGPHTGGGGSDPILGDSVRTRKGPGPTWRFGPYIQGSSTLPWGPDSLSMPWSTSPSPATWRCCCWPRVVTRGWGESRPGPTHNFFTTRLKIAAWVLRLHTVVRGTLVSGYRHNLHKFKQTNIIK
jgi:hypothetical protein